jgi:hypothetical protein
MVRSQRVHSPRPVRLELEQISLSRQFLYHKKSEFRQSRRRDEIRAGGLIHTFMCQVNKNTVYTKKLLSWDEQKEKHLRNGRTYKVKSHVY